MSESRAELSVLGPSTRLTGHISGKGGLRVEGRVSGNIDVTGPAELAEGASLTGDLAAGSLDLGGELLGNVTTQGAVVVRANARLRGEVKSSEVTIEPGARVALRLDTPFDFEPEFGKR